MPYDINVTWRLDKTTNLSYDAAREQQGESGGPMSVEHATGEKEMEGKSVAYDHLFRQFTNGTTRETLLCTRDRESFSSLSCCGSANPACPEDQRKESGSRSPADRWRWWMETNRFDVHYLAEFARRLACRPAGSAGARHDGRRITPEDLLDRIFVSRAFTCYQMEAAITERLPAFLRRSGSSVGGDLRIA